MARYDDENRGIFGYEGEGYMRGGASDVEDLVRRIYRRPEERTAEEEVGESMRDERE